MTKLVCSVVFLGMCASSMFAQEASIVRWKQIVGVITSPNVDNPVAMATDAQGQTSAIHAGAGPWSATRGNARVDLVNSTVTFNVTGMVMNGGNQSGNVPANFKIVGTLVCNSGTTDVITQKDTPPVILSTEGDADFSGPFTTSVPPNCVNPLFLIRVPSGKWIATGAIRTISAQ